MSEVAALNLDFTPQIEADVNLPLANVLDLAGKSELNSAVEGEISAERRSDICKGIASAACELCVARSDCPILRMRNFAKENLQLDPERESYLDDLLSDGDEVVVAGYSSQENRGLEKSTNSEQVVWVRSSVNESDERKIEVGVDGDTDDKTLEFRKEERERVVSDNFTSALSENSDNFNEKNAVATQEETSPDSNSNSNSSSIEDINDSPLEIESESSRRLHEHRIFETEPGETEVSPSQETKKLGENEPFEKTPAEDDRQRKINSTNPKKTEEIFELPDDSRSKISVEPRAKKTKTELEAPNLPSWKNVQKTELPQKLNEQKIDKKSLESPEKSKELETIRASLRARNDFVQNTHDDNEAAAESPSIFKNDEHDRVAPEAAKYDRTAPETIELINIVEKITTKRMAKADNFELTDVVREEVDFVTKNLPGEIDDTKNRPDHPINLHDFTGETADVVFEVRSELRVENPAVESTFGPAELHEGASQTEDVRRFAAKLNSESNSTSDFVSEQRPKNDEFKPELEPFDLEDEHVEITTREAELGVKAKLEHEKTAEHNIAPENASLQIGRRVSSGLWTDDAPANPEKTLNAAGSTRPSWLSLLVGALAVLACDRAAG